MSLVSISFLTPCKKYLRDRFILDAGLLTLYRDLEEERIRTDGYMLTY